MVAILFAFRAPKKILGFMRYGQWYRGNFGCEPPTQLTASVIVEANKKRARRGQRARPGGGDGRRG
jgi:hypothetical protein